jgi:hypothetical protein
VTVWILDGTTGWRSPDNHSMILLWAGSRTRMRGMFKLGMFRLIHLRALVLVIALGCGVVPWAIGQAASSVAADHPAAAAHPHSVKLSWAASVPASKSPADAVVGYNVYRSTASHDRHPKRINSALCAGTTYTDPAVETGKTYFYVTRGVNAKGVESASSNEIKVVMPPR